MRAIRIALVVGSIALMTACGSSSNNAASTSSSSRSSSAGSSSSPASTASKSSATLPGPCTLLTTQDVASFFDGAAVTAKPSTSPAPGVAQCSFTLSVGSQAKQVNIETLTDYANNPAYVFPSPSTTVPSIGDLAVIETTNTNEHRITVKLGSNAIQITVDFVDKTPDDSFLTQLARSAVGRT